MYIHLKLRMNVNINEMSVFNIIILNFFSTNLLNSV